MNSLIGALDRNPLAIILLASVDLALFAWLLIPERARRTIFAVIVIMPLSPILALRLLAVMVITVCDWAVSDRRWTEPAQRHARWLQREFDL